MRELKDKEIEQVVGGDNIDVEFYYQYEIFPTAAVTNIESAPFTVFNSSNTTAAVKIIDKN